MTTPIERVSLPLTSPLLIAALLFSTSACSNPATVNTSNNVPEQKESQTSKADMRTSDAQLAQTSLSLQPKRSPLLMSLGL